MQPDKRNTSNNTANNMAAAMLTLLLSCATVAFLFFTYLSVDTSAKQLTTLQDSIIFGGEYVMLGDIEQTETDDLTPEEQVEEQQEEVKPDPQVEGHDLKDNGKNAREDKPVITDKKESPMKVKEEPKKPEPKKETGKAKKEDPKKPEQTKNNEGGNKTTDNRVKNAFAQGGKGGGKQGNPNGNSTTGGQKEGQPGFNGDAGYTLAHFGRPHSPYIGTVKVKVRINSRGQVIDAQVVSGSGEAYRSAAVKADCIKESKKSAFSVPKNRTTEGVGYITWKFV